MVSEICCEVRRSKAKPAGAANILVGVLTPVYKTLHIIPSLGYLLEQKSSKAALDVGCAFTEVKGATLGLCWGKCDEMISCSRQLFFGENFLASINRLLSKQLS